MPSNDIYNLKSQTYTAVVPSNIALVKYWGKRDASLQWPANDSISMTLSKCRSITTAQKSHDHFDTFEFGNTRINSRDLPEHKVFRHLKRIRESIGTAEHLALSTHNTFPADCGIASSASGFGALTLAAAAALIDTCRWDELSTRGLSRQTLANLARMGSGSAGRSFFGGFVQWTGGNSPTDQSINQIHQESHWNLADLIVVISQDAKHVSSTEAHQGAWGSPLFKPRLAGLDTRLKRVKRAIDIKDLECLGYEIEQDALEMHAVSMTGSPSINFFTETTIRFISWIRTERGRGNLPAWFTIDAGPNVHVICRQADAPEVCNRIKKEWSELKVIMDQVGSGPSIVMGELETAHV